MIVLHGGNGFLGAHIARAAVEAGLEVGATGRSARPAPSLPVGIAYEQADTRSARDLLRGSDMIVYLAHASRPANEADGLSHELSVNVDPLCSTVNALAESGYGGQFVYTSSGGQIYGRGLDRPARETDPVRPATAYGTGKLMCETVVGHAARNLGLHALTLRLANPVGEHQIGTSHGLVGAIFRALREDIPLWMFGSGGNVRDYFAADDFGDFLVALHGRSYRGSGVFNIGSGLGLTETDVLDTVADVVGRRPDVDRRPAREFDLPYAVVDPASAGSELGWRAKTPFRHLVADMAREGGLVDATTSIAI